MVKKIEPWFGFTEDKVFGMVMENKEFCKYLLEIIIPDLKIKKIDWLDRQVEINNLKRKNEAKEVRLDVLVTDHKGRVFNIEMQTTDQDDIGRRMRYYLSRLDLRYTLNKGKTYRNLKDAYIIFLCNFKPKKDDKFYESYHIYSDQDKSKQLQDGVTKIIINSQVSAKGQSEDLKALAKLMNNEPVKLNKHFDYAQRRIKEINEDPETREKIMLYETRMLEREQAAGKAASRLPLSAEKAASKLLLKGAADCSGRLPRVATPGRGAVPGDSAEVPAGTALCPDLPGASAGIPLPLRSHRRAAPAWERRSGVGYGVPVAACPDTRPQLFH